MHLQLFQFAMFVEIKCKSKKQKFALMLTKAVVMFFYKKI